MALNAADFTALLGINTGAGAIALPSDAAITTAATGTGAAVRLVNEIDDMARTTVLDAEMPNTVNRVFSNYGSTARRLAMFDSTSEMFLPNGGGSMGRANIFNQITARLDGFDELKQAVGTIKDEFSDLNQTGSAARSADRVTGRLERNLKRVKDTLARDEKALSSAVGNVIADHAKASAALLTEVQAQQTALTTQYQTRLTRLTNALNGASAIQRGFVQDNINELKANFAAANSHLKTVSETVRSRHTDTIAEIKSLFKEVGERTGVVISTAEAGTASQLVRAGEPAAQNIVETTAEHMGGRGMGVGRMVVGAGLLGGGAALAFQDSQQEGGPGIKTGLGVVSMIAGAVTLLKKAVHAAAESGAMRV